MSHRVQIILKHFNSASCRAVSQPCVADATKEFPAFDEQFPEAHKKFCRGFGLKLDVVSDGRYSISEKERWDHGRDRDGYVRGIPQAVIWPRTTEEVVQIINICNEHKVPIIPYGNGTSLEGHTAAVHGGISVDVRQMKRVIRINLEDMDIELEPGVDYTDLNEELHPKGVWITPDPAPHASVGGMVSTNCSGPNAVKYGMMRDNVINLTVVLPTGKVIKTARRARKSSSGYDLTRLFVGAEGTLGIITALTLKLKPLPETEKVGICAFPSVLDCANAVIEIIQKGVDMTCLEMMDDRMTTALNNFCGTNYEETTQMFLKLSGTQAQVESNSEAVQQIVSHHHGGKIKFSNSEEEAAEIWDSRKMALYACRSLMGKKDMQIMITDVAVPISKFAEIISKTKEEIDASPLDAPLVAHAGDGNFHACIVFDKNDPEQLEIAHRLNDNMVKRAMEMDGTATGEHGIGSGKRRYLMGEFGAETLEVMNAIKRALDPNNIMNPGKAI